MLNLKYNADIRTLFSILVYYGLMITCFVIPLGGIWQTVGLVGLNCFLSFLCAVIIHNTVHVPMFKSQWANRAMQVILSITWGHAISAFVPGHNFSHHMYTNTDKDTINTHKVRFKINFFNQLFFSFMVIPDVLASEVKFISLVKKDYPKWYGQYLAEMIIYFAITIGLLIFDWQKFILFYFIPHLYAVWGLLGVNFFQHDGTDETHPYNHSRNLVGKYFNWFFFNNGYHGAHHMRPDLHWSLLPEFHEKNIKPYIHPNLDQKNLLVYLIKSHIYPAKRVDYLGNPVILQPKRKEKHLWIEHVDMQKNKNQLGAVEAA